MNSWLPNTKTHSFEIRGSTNMISQSHALSWKNFWSLTEGPCSLSLLSIYLSIYLSSCLPVYLWCSCTCRVVSLCTCSCRCSWSEATSAPPKVVRNPTVFNILTSKYASRHNGVRFFETPHLSLQKWSEPLVFCTFWLRNVLRATTACTFSKLDLWASKSGPNP